MPRPLKAKIPTRISATREGSTYQLQIEDDAGKRVLFELTSKQTLQLADVLDSLLADEEEELALQLQSNLSASWGWLAQSKG